MPISVSRSRAASTIRAAIRGLPSAVAGTRMSVAAMKSIWPFFGAPKVRAWVEEHVAGGTIERLMIATNAPMSTLKSSGPPIPDDGLAVEIVGHGAEIRPVAGPALDPRCRLQRPRHRPHRDGQCRARQRGDLARPQAVDHQRRVRGAGYFPEGAARQGAFPSRRLGAGGGGAAGAGAAARAFRHAARSGDQPRHPDRAGDARHAAQGRSRARIVDSTRSPWT